MNDEEEYLETECLTTFYMLPVFTISKDGDVDEDDREVMITGFVEYNPRRVSWRVSEMTVSDESGASVYVDQQVAAARLVLRYFELRRMM